MKRALVLAGGGARGAFQAGAVKYLSEKYWKPDMICGVSVGALNAVALGSGMTPDALVSHWKNMRHRKVFNFGLPNFVTKLFSSKEPASLVAPGPLAELIREHISFESLKQSETEVVIAAVNIRTSQIAYFDNRTIGEEHVIASAAMPLMCSWQDIDGEPYWDGGVMDNVPILPALKSGADEIVVVLLSAVDVFKQEAPSTMLEAAEMAFEQALVGSFNTLLADRTWPESGISGAFHSPLPNSLKTVGENTKIGVVAPVRMLGFKSLSDFSPGQCAMMVREGYEAARKQLAGFL